MWLLASGPFGRFQMCAPVPLAQPLGGWQEGGRASPEKLPNTLIATLGNQLVGATSIANTGNIYQVFLEK